MSKRVSWLLLFLAFGLVFSTKAFASAYGVGDIFAAVGNGKVEEFTQTGTLVQTLNTGLGGFTTGMAFDGSGNLYVTDFSTGDVSKFDNNGNLVNAKFITGMTNPESILFNKAGEIYVGDAGSNLIRHFDASGTLLNSFTAATEARGTDWIDLAADQKTILYTSEGSHVKSFDVSANAQNADFSNLGHGVAYALRILPDGTVLVADSTEAMHLDAAGNIIKTYSLPGNGGGDFSLNLDPNGVDFWTGDFATGVVWKVNIATGAIDGTFNTGAGASALFGLALFGEKTAGGPPPIPEPGTMLLMGTGLAGLLFKRFKKS